MGAKRSQRRAVRFEKDQSGCMWGLISMFDFRHGRSTRKLIADRRHGSKHTLGTGISKNKFEVLSNLEENCQGTIGYLKRYKSRVKPGMSTNQTSTAMSDIEKLPEQGNEQ
ncbi:hypothetical protein L484_006557 [Morus notabilis]|uniref:Uncharacterized protein n=1 Tax=Morus notabilis TaxID=981085 RepID=W9S5D5_9ROSA|nr:hypothetical protein L484_006557 [Morus notabilis]